jgi:hypothetical protein
MNKTRLVALAATLCTGVALSAVAQPYGPDRFAPSQRGWDRIGSVDFSFRRDRETEYGNFGGSVERLAFRARNGDVRCRSVTATFNNGRTQRLYRGVMSRGRDVVVDIPGQRRMIRRIDFDCRSLERRETTVDISADIGRYRAEWRRSPNWDRTWSRMFNWTDDQYGDNRPGYPYGGTGRDRLEGPLDTAGWVTLGTEVFDGRIDRETTFAGFAGRNVERIAVRAVNDDARCSEITATFANGRTRALNIGEANLLREDRVYELDLPGISRDVTRIDMTCHANNGRQVTMLVMANR